MNTIGRYELEEKLGEGGMGVVYRARDPLLDRVIALKLISASVEGNPELRERFFREARAAGQLSHKSIITIHDLGEHEGQPYLTMEYLRGQDLQRRLSRGAVMSLGRKLQLAIEVCEGLEYAHARGVIHRDIKPANIFITEDGTVKLLDFGLARLVTSELTHSNMMMGTLNYMAPEQVRGERADHRSDIFSMGVVLYELLGGRKAFEGDSVASTLYRILQEVPEPLLNLDPTLPPEAITIVDRALGKAREERYQHMGEMLGDLVVVRQQLGFQDSPAGGFAASGEMPTIPGTPSPAYGIPASRPGSRPQVSRPPGSRPQATPPETSPPSAPASTPATAAIPVRRLSPGLAAAIAAVLVIAAAAIWLPRGASTPPPTTDPMEREARAAEIETSVQQASLLLRAGDYEAARREADAVLARVPDHAEARRIRDRAQETADSVTVGLREAQAHYDAARYEEAARAAGDVLAVVPTNADARRLMEDSSARMRGRGAEDARERMAQAKAGAIASRAPSLAASAFSAATRAEQDAQRLFKAGRAGDATVRFYEASGLFRSSELAARTEAAIARRADTTRADATRSEAPPPPASPTPPSPPRPAAPETQVGPPVLPGSSSSQRPVLPPAPPPAAVAAPVPSPAPGSVPAPGAGASERATAVETPSVAPEQAIRDLLARYESALEARNLEALRRLWPALAGAQQTAIGNEFRHASRIDVEIHDPRISITGATATVTFTRRYEMQTVEGQRLRTDTRTTMTLRRNGANWLIEDIRFEAR